MFNSLQVLSYGRRRRVRLGGLTVLVALTVAGCGGEEVEAKESARADSSSKKPSAVKIAEVRDDLNSAFAAAGMGDPQLRDNEFGGPSKNCPGVTGALQTRSSPTDAALGELVSALKARHWKQEFQRKEAEGSGWGLNKGTWQLTLLGGHTDGTPASMPTPSVTGSISGMGEQETSAFTGVTVMATHNCSASK